MNQKINLADAVQNPNVQKMLGLLAHTEGTDKLYGYKTLVGGGKVEDLSKHPNIVGMTTKDGKSTAAGRYQITGTTWRGLQKKYGLGNDFSPGAQDLAAVALMKDAGALGAVLNGDFGKAINKVKDIWVSLPGSSTKNQREESWTQVNKYLNGSAPTDQVERRAASSKTIINPKQQNIKTANNQPTNTGVLDDFDNWYAQKQQGQAQQPAANATNNDPILSDFDSWYATKQDKQQSGGILNTISNAASTVADMFTGNDRKTAETEALPDYAGMPELNDLTSMAGWKTGLGTLLSNPEETAKVIKANYPNVEVKQDQKGNYLLKSSADNNWYAIKPGFQISDIPRAIGGVAAFTPAGRATSILGAGAAGAATQAAIEGSQAAAGGEFNPSEVVTAGVLGAATPAIINAVKAAPSVIKNAGDAVKNTATQVVDKLETAALANQSPKMGFNQQPQMGLSQLGAKARRAAEGGIGSGKSTQEFAASAAPDAKTVEAAKRLGIDQYLQPDHVTTNQVFREISQAVKSIPGSEARMAEISGLGQIAKKADDIIQQMGGTTDVSVIDTNVKTAMRTTQQQLEKKADDFYAQLRQGIPAQAEAPAENVLAFINQRAEDLGGVENLSPMERMIAKKLSPSTSAKASGGMAEESIPKLSTKQPTYALLDDVRRDLTAARVKRQGSFKDADTGLIKKLEMELKKDQAIVVAQHGMKDVFDQAQKSVAIRKGLEDDMVALFGKELDKSIAPALATATKALPAGDPSKFIKLLKVVPEEQRQQTVAAGLLTAFGKNAKNGDLNFNSYANWYEGLLRNKKSYAAIMNNLPKESRQQLKDLYRVSNGIRLASRERIETGRLNAALGELKDPDTAMSNLYSIARRSIVGLAIEAVTTSLGMPGAGISAGIASALTKGKTPALKAVDALINSPDFQILARSINTKNEKAAIKKMANSKNFIKVLKITKNKEALKNREKFLTALLKSAAPKIQDNQNNQERN